MRPLILYYWLLLRCLQRTQNLILLDRSAWLHDDTQCICYMCSDSRALVCLDYIGSYSMLCLVSGWMGDPRTRLVGGSSGVPSATTCDICKGRHVLFQIGRMIKQGKFWNFDVGRSEILIGKCLRRKKSIFLTGRFCPK